MSTTPVDLPTYIKNSNQESYHELFNLIARTWLSSNGWTIPQITDANLTALMALTPPPPDGTIWFVTDHVPPVYAGVISGALVQFTTAAYP